jgi:hypothetical protein
MTATPGARRRLLACGLALALLWAACFGAWHAAAHARPHADAAIAAIAAHAGDHGGDHTADLTADHRAGDLQCRLLDQSLHADGLAFGAVPQSEAAPPPPSWPLLALGAPVTRPWRAQARGPPPNRQA